MLPAITIPSAKMKSSNEAYKMIIILAISFVILFYISSSSKSYKLISWTKPAQAHGVSYKIIDTGTGQSKITSFVFVKIPKTGSTTLFSILSRFSKAHSLNLLMPVYRNASVSEWLVGPKVDEKPEVLINFAVYDPQALDHRMKNGYKLIVPVREPVAWMVSASSNFLKKSAEEVVNNDEYMLQEVKDSKGLHVFHLRQLCTLGFDYANRYNVSAMMEYINFILQRTDIVMLHEQYDASLLILKQRFNWDYADIFYKKYMTGTYYHNSPKLTEKTREILLSKEVNFGDLLLYEALNKTWWKQPEVQTEEFWVEVEYFASLNARISANICPNVNRTLANHIIPANQYHGQIIITVDMCQQLFLKNSLVWNSLFRYGERKKIKNEWLKSHKSMAG